MNPMSTPANAASRRQSGVVAVELAIIMCLTAFLLPAIFLFGRVFLQYNVLKQATQDAANYMATLPLAEMRNPAKVSDATARAQVMVQTAVTEAGIVSALDLPIVVCNGLERCGTNHPVSVTVATILTINGWDFQITTSQWLNDSLKWTIPASSTVAYAN